MFTEDLFLYLNTLLPSYSKEQVYIITDENTARCCLPVFCKQISDFPPSFMERLSDNTLVLPSGEQNKDLQHVQVIWDFLIEKHATRQALLILLGGGVITDMGGFAASCYMRGIDFVNIPTSLLAMIDAAEGGKTGIDYRGLKNQVGLFREAKANLLYMPFLLSLPAEQFLSGYAEMIKHALIADQNELNRLLGFDINGLYHPANSNERQALLVQLQDLITRSLEIKRYLVELDPQEQHMRKCLNFGHTVGHALEELHLQKYPDRPSYHGFAVMWGMLVELYISHIRFGLPTDVITRLSQFTLSYYGRPEAGCREYEQLVEWMRHDKKNASDVINFTLLKQVGNPQINQTASLDEIHEALDYLFTL